ncbi:MAG TPA: diaminopimelate decarboxylase [bacterium]|uniref:Diaminopimelate decarboxylase n=1 Tax=candidate division TA06 bacterium ADurb.Bin417 TaxID=1852828 RepID=A0A1V5MLV0_UNCT6|nr:MAG: Diaminopimelate decarboxylase [candidate division TA06 bacterium ADurb.Bin417]HNQ34451.1 diaminopimelate decarboxylase [bacterium]HNS48139.1 diaminopimelate decarboxylase [bacterium]
MTENYLSWPEGRGRLEECFLDELADRYGTPLYLYSETGLRRRLGRFRAAFKDLDPLVRYSCKANANTHLLSIIRAEGGGADVISAGELMLALAAGFEAADLIMEGPGKRPDEMALALENGVAFFSVESEAELESLSRLAAERKLKATILLRLNPDIAAGGHQYISTGRKENKFGLTEAEVISIFKAPERYRPLRIGGLHLHLGSQIDTPEPYLKAVREAKRLHASHPFEYLDLGGGFPVVYDKEVTELELFAEAIGRELDGLPVRVIFEPGRYLVAPVGFLLTRITYRKDRPHRRFLVVDAGMNDLIRPSLYEAFHQIWPVRSSGAAPENFDVVGPICESGDFLARERPLPADLAAGGLLLVGQAGAYGFAMSSNYNGRLRPAEVLVRGSESRVIRRRQNYEDLLAGM